MEGPADSAEPATEEPPGARETTLEAIAQREREMRRSLIEARDALIRRDEEIDRLHRELEAVIGESAGQSGASGAGGAADDGGRRALEKKAKRLTKKLDKREQKVAEQRMRLLRLERSLPVRVVAGVSALPLLRTVATRREKAFERAVKKAKTQE